MGQIKLFCWKLAELGTPECTRADVSDESNVLQIDVISIILCAKQLDQNIFAGSVL